MPPRPTPLLSIIVTSLDNPHGVASLFSETPKTQWGKVEYIVVDDGSRAENAILLDQFADSYPNCTIVHNLHNLGVVLSQIRGVERATGEYLLFRGADDRNLPALWKVLETSVASKSYNLIVGDILKSTPNSRSSYPERSAWLPVGESKLFGPDEFCAIVNEKQIWGQSTFIRRTCYEAHGGFRNELSFLSDPTLFHTVASIDGIFYVSEALAEVGVDPQSFSATGTSRTTSRQQAFKNLISHLLSQTPAVQSAYARTGWLGRWGTELAEVYLATPSLWSHTTNLLLSRNLHYLEQERNLDTNRGIEAPYFHKALKKLASEHPENYSKLRIGIFGCGSAAKTLLRVYQDSPFPLPQALITNNASEADRIELYAIPIIRFDQLAPESLDYLIIASKAYQEELAQQANQVLPKTKLILPFS